MPSEPDRRGRTILREASLALLVLDQDERIVEVLGDFSPGGRPLAEWVGRSVVEALRDLGITAEPPKPGETVCAEIDGRRLEVRAVRGAGQLHGILVVLDLTTHGTADEAARARMHQIQQMVRQMPCTAWATDKDLRIVYFLGESEGVSSDQVLGVSVEDLAATREPADEAITSHLAALRGECSSYRYFVRGRWFEVHVEPLRDEHGDIAGCIGAAVDITRRKEVEERAVESEARMVQAQRRSISLLEATIESTADGILVVDLNGRIVAYNRRFAALWDIPVAMADRGDDAELLEFAGCQLVDPDDFLRGVRELYERSDAESLDVLRFTDGRVFERYSRPQRVGDEIVGRVWSFRDVSERDRTLRHALFLSDASRLLTTLDAVAALDGVARLALTALGQVSAVEFVTGTTARRVLAWSNDAETAPSGELPPAVLSGHALVREFEGRKRLSVPLVAIGRVAGAITVIGAAGREFTREEIELVEEVARRAAVALENSRQYQAGQQEVRAREEFLAVASHEIRGPVASIRLAVQAFRRQLAPPETLIDVIEREERRLARLADDLLDLGRVQAGQLRFEIEEVDLAAVVREVEERVAGELARSGSTLTVQAPDPVRGCWDRMRLDQVVGNLLSNAIKFGSGQPIEVSVSPHDGHAVLEVRDHGLGIPSELQRTVFEPFERAVPARHYGGLGLGLYIVRTIVHGLGGTIDLQSTPGSGSTFVVELPLERAA